MFNTFLWQCTHSFKHLMWILASDSNYCNNVSNVNNMKYYIDYSRQIYHKIELLSDLEKVNNVPISRW